MAIEGAERPGRAPPLHCIQAARGIAALLVAAFHLSLLLDGRGVGGAGAFLSATWWGFRGVDFFFVLSGFIIMLAHGRDIGRPAGLGRYLWNRGSRIYPAYWLYTLFVLAVSAAGAGALLMHVADPAGLLSTITLVRFGAGEPPVGVAWTLFHEILFYAAFALLILDRRLGVAVMAAWAVAILVARLHPTPHTPLGTLIGTYNMNFFFGIAAFLISMRIGARAGMALVLGALPLLGAMIALEARGGGTIPIHAGYALAFAMAIAGAARVERSGRRMTLPGFGALGDASYSLYLTHVTMQAYMVVVLERLGLLAAVPGPLLWIAMLAATVAIGIGAYHGLERPLIALTRRIAPGRRPAAGRAVPS